MKRFIVMSDVPPRLADVGFVAYVADNQHPDNPIGGKPLSCSWHQTHDDAYRVADALNGAQ